jgi:hypothetical protein
MNPKKSYVLGGLGLAVLTSSLLFGGLGQGQAGPVVSGNVVVTNTSAQAVPVSVQPTALQPWQGSFSLDMGDGETSKMVPLPALPAGKRLVIEFASSELIVLKEQLPSVQIFGTLEGSGSIAHVLDVSNIGDHSPGQFRWRGSHTVKMYLDNGFVRVNRSGGSANVFFGSVALSGYLIDVP